MTLPFYSIDCKERVCKFGVSISLFLIGLPCMPKSLPSIQKVYHLVYHLLRLPNVNLFYIGVFKTFIKYQKYDKHGKHGKLQSILITILNLPYSLPSFLDNLLITIKSLSSFRYVKVVTFTQNFIILFSKFPYRIGLDSK